MLEKLKQLVTEEEGQGMVEYGLILALVAVVVIVALQAIGSETNEVFKAIENKLKGIEKPS
jgi:pilus assembly protein Flp/PilA